MTEVTVVKNDLFGELTAIEKDGGVWFIAKEVADKLEYSETSKMTIRLRDKHKAKIKSTELEDSKFGNNDMTIISEAGVLKAIMGSKKPEAEKFEDWIIEEVIPSILKTGKYDVAVDHKLDSTQAMVEWEHQSNSILGAIGDLVSDDLKKRFVLETGSRIEKETNTEIIPESMERAFLLGEDVVKDEGVAKVQSGGNIMILRDIAEKLGRTNIPDISKALIDLGLQTKCSHKTHRGSTIQYYVPTDKGMKYCVTSSHKTLINKHHIKGLEAYKEYTKISGWYIEHIYDVLVDYFENK